MKKIICLLLLLSMVLGCASCQQTPTTQTAFYLDTVCTITIYESTSKKSNQTLIDQAFAKCADFERVCSPTLEESTLYQLNHAQGRAMTVPQVMLDLIALSQKYTALSDGLFDITIAPVKALWNFKADAPSVPSKEQLQTALQAVSMDNIRVSGEQVQLLCGAQLDFGAIGKGYLCGEITKDLKDAGVTRAIVNFGGNLSLIGGKDAHSPWTIGIQEPFANTDVYAGTLQASDASVVTSGIYERYFEKDGVVYHHILDPRTGMPVQNDLYSATVVAKEGAQADALSTIFLMMGSARVKELVAAFEKEPQLWSERAGLSSAPQIYLVDNQKKLSRIL